MLFKFNDSSLNVCNNCNQTEYFSTIHKELPWQLGNVENLALRPRFSTVTSGPELTFTHGQPCLIHTLNISTMMPG